MSDPLTINGSYLREIRESLGWSHGEVASRACLSVKQVKQLEEGGASSFYSDNVKLTAARKVAGILGVSEADLLGTPALEVASFEDDELQPSHQHGTTPLVTEKETLPEEANLLAQFESQATASSATHLHQPILTPGVEALTIRSEVLHFLAQPPEEGQDEHHFHDSLESQVPSSTHHTSETPDAQSVGAYGEQNTEVHEHTLSANVDQTGVEHHTDLAQSSSPAEVKTSGEQSSSNSASNLFKIIILFLLALGIAAFFAQKTNEEHSEPPPPLQSVPESSSNAADSNAKTEDSTSATPTGSSSGSAGNATNASSVSTSSNATNNAGVAPPKPMASAPTAPPPAKTPSTEQKPASSSSNTVNPSSSNASGTGGPNTFPTPSN